MTSEKIKPALLLLPNLLGEMQHHAPYLPESIDKAVSTIDGLIAESASSGRRYLGRFQTKKPAHNMPLALYNHNTPDEDLDFLLEPIKNGERWGLISDAGLPCIADPGANLVRRARKLGIPVQAFSGPSSLFLALMLSGIPSQKFSFLGYLPKEEENLILEIKKMETSSRVEKMTYVFIETPYRNETLLKTLMETCKGSTWICCAWDLTLPGQGVVSFPVDVWKKSPLPNIHKKNAIFILSAAV